jgi:2-succinyl-6-hydroxy-2,4-cyclohexadiene-1-carboxylate synthase
MRIYALHGFLGTKYDWDDFPKLQNIIPIDISQFCSSLEEWADQFNQFAKADFEEKILLGYSLGGRLSLYALSKAPHLWKAAIFVSTHSGLTSKEEKKQRYETDLQWAKRFQTEPWDSLMKQWNQQPVFHNDVEILRKESQYDRNQLAHILDTWSLANQKDFKPQLEKLHLPVLWVVGEWDSKFVKIAESLKFRHPLSKIWIASGAAHRVPWTAKEAFQNEVNQFLSEVKA